MRAVAGKGGGETNVGAHQEIRENHVHSCKVGTAAGER